MAFIKLTYIYCDFCASGEPLTPDATPGATATEERRWNGPGSGWTFPNINHHVYDRCAECTQAKAKTPLW